MVLHFHVFVYFFVKMQSADLYKAADLSPNVLYSRFLSRVRKNLHIILAMSSQGTDFAHRLRRFPALVFRCTLNWFQPWPQEAFKMVALKEFDNLEIGDDVKQNAVKVASKIHQMAIERCEEFYAATRRRIYITPTYFLHFLHKTKQLIETKTYEISTARDRLAMSLERVDSIGKDIEKMREELAETPPLLEKTTRETNELIEIIENEAAQVEERKRLVEADEKEADDQAKQAQNIKEEFEHALADALPALNAAVSSLNTLNASHITVIKTMQKPPAGVRLVMEAVCVMKGIKPLKVKDNDTGKVTDDYWPEAKKMLNDLKFLDSLRDYDKDNIPPGIIKQIREKYISNPEFDPNVIKNVSSACEGLCKWVRAVEQYNKVATVIAPRRKSLKIAETELAEQTVKVTEKQKEIKILESKLQQLKSDFEAKVEEKRKLEANIDQCNQKIARAEKMTASLHGNKDRWVSMAERLAKETQFIVGNGLMSSAIINYLAGFSNDFRQETIVKFQELCTNSDIMVQNNFSLLETLGNAVQLRDWQLKGLPIDSFSAENGIIITQSYRFPLIIDPQGQANRWIRKMESDRNLCVIKASDPNYLQNLESCIQFGTPCLLENIGEELDPVLDSLLLRQIIRQNGASYVKIGENLVEYSNDFQFYMTTRQRNPHYSAEVAMKANLVNFLITPESLRKQIVDYLMKIEVPKLNEENALIFQEISENERQLQLIEDQILELLSQEDVNFLVDETTIAIISNSDELMLKVSQVKARSEAIENEIESVHAAYLPCARHFTAIYSAVTSMFSINHMYQKRLSWFIQLLGQVADNTEQSDNVEKRVEMLNANLLRTIFEKFSSTIFQSDKPILSLQLVCALEISEGRLTMEEWRVILDLSSIRRDQCEISEKIHRLLHIQAFHGLREEIEANYEIWHKFASNENSLIDDLPKPFSDSLTPLRKVLLFQTFHNHRILHVFRTLMDSLFGQNVLEKPPPSLKQQFDKSNKITPLIYIPADGTDLMESLMALAKGENIPRDKIKAISLGNNGSAEISKESFQDAMEKGYWLVFENCHLSRTWFPELEHFVETLRSSGDENCSENFRLWLTTKPCPDFPVAILQNSVQIIADSPLILKANILNNFINNPIASDPSLFEDKDHARMVYKLVLNHSRIQTRQHLFKPRGWQHGFELSQEDLSISIQSALTNQGNIEGCQYLIAKCFYGGHVISQFDQNVIDDFISNLYQSDEYIGDGEGLASFNDVLKSVAENDKLTIDATHKFVAMKENSDDLLRKMQMQHILEQLELILPPKKSMVKPAASRNVQLKMVSALANQIPSELNHSHVDPSKSALNCCLINECNRYNQLVKTIKASLHQLVDVLKGLRSTNQKCNETLHDLTNDKVPQHWLHYPSMKNLEKFLQDLHERVEFFRHWISNEKTPKTIFVEHFFDFKCFLNCLKLDSFDDSCFNVDIECNFVNHIDENAEGIFVDGLFLDGANWSTDKRTIVETSSKSLINQVPMVNSFFFKLLRWVGLHSSSLIFFSI